MERPLKCLKAGKLTPNAQASCLQAGMLTLSAPTHCKSSLDLQAAEFAQERPEKTHDHMSVSTAKEVPDFRAYTFLSVSTTREGSGRVLSQIYECMSDAKVVPMYKNAQAGPGRKNSA
eukprot:1156943-Pelagomonas_calceolata.AAC.6